MKKVMLVGGGKIGIAITEFLSSTDDYKVTVVDRDAASLQRMPRNNNVELRKVDIVSPEFVHEVEGHDIVLSATPFNLTATVAEACKRANAHYLDLTEDVESTRTIKRLSDGAKTAFLSWLLPKLPRRATVDLHEGMKGTWARVYETLDAEEMPSRRTRRLLLERRAAARRSRPCRR